jgi:D-alanine transaminase
MSRIAYVNGAYVPHSHAAVHIEDRGYQLGDAVYEVWAVFDGKMADAEGHFARLERSMAELKMTPPMDRRAMTVVLREVLRRNRVKNGIVYIQVSRGAARRDHVFPAPDTAPAMVVTARNIDPALGAAKAQQGIKVVTVPETRWGRCDIKTVNLLPNCLARQTAKEQGAAEAWFVDSDGLVTEGAATNAWIVDQEGVLHTRTIEANILRGITRSTLMRVVADKGLTVDQQPFTVAQAQAAKEAFITGAGTLVMPVVEIDGKKLGDGKPGPLATQLRETYMQYARDASV